MSGGSRIDGSKLEIFGLNPQTSKVYHVVDFSVRDYFKSAIVNDFYITTPLPNEQLPYTIAFAAYGTQLFVVEGMTGTFYTCDVSGPGPHTWEEGPSLIAAKMRPILFVLGHELFVLGTATSHGSLVEFEKLDLGAEGEKQGKRSWEELPDPPMLQAGYPLHRGLYYAIDQQAQIIYFPTTHLHVPWDICMFDSHIGLWCAFCQKAYDSDVHDTESDRLVFNLMRIPRWDGCAPIVYDKIYLMQHPYCPPKCQNDGASPTKLAIICYNLKARTCQRDFDRDEHLDLSYMTPKHIAGLHRCFTYPSVHAEYELGAVVHMGGGRFCCAAWFCDDRESGLISSMAATVFNLSLNRIKGDFPEAEKVMHGPCGQVDDLVLCAQGAVLEGFYKFAHDYYPREVQVGQTTAMML